MLENSCVIAKFPQGKRLAQLDKPKGVVVCPKGHTFVAEKGNNRVQVFDSNANFISSFGEKSGSNKMISPYGIFIREDNNNNNNNNVNLLSADSIRVCSSAL